MNSVTVIAGAMALLGVSTAAFAQTPPPPPAAGPTLAVAAEAAQAAVTACADAGYKVTALVVDSADVPKALLVGDGAPGMTVAIATRKAHTAITYKVPTAEIGEKAKTDAALKATIDADPKLITWAGAQPLMKGEILLGALAVSGAPGGDKDDACVTAAVAKIKGKL